VRRFNLYAVIMLSLLYVGCSTVPSADTPEDRVAIGYLTIESVAKSTGLAYDNGWISLEEKQRIRGTLQLAHDAFGQVLALQALGRADDARLSLRIAESLLDGLELILQERTP